MGKSRRKKVSCVRPKVRELDAVADDAEIDDLKENILESIAADLNSGSLVKKECACALMGVLAERRPRGILDQKLVRMVAPLMLEEGPALRFAAVSALKSLSLTSDDVSDEMVAQDVMTPLCALVNSYSDCQKAKDFGGGVYVEAVELLSNLCEASVKALAVFNRCNLVHVLLRHANPELGHDIMLATLQCLYSVAENNPDVWKDIREAQDLWSKLLVDDGGKNTHSDLMAKIVTVGVLLNAMTSESELQLLPIVFDVISEVLKQDQVMLVMKYASLDPVRSRREEKPSKKLSNGCVDEMDFVSGSESQRQETAELTTLVQRCLTSQQVALEILANLCCEEDDEDESEWEDDLDLNSDISGDNVSLEGQLEASGARWELKVSGQVLERISTLGLVGVVLSKANLPDEQVCDSLQTKADGKIILQMISTLRSRSFLCLNNVFGAMSLEEAGGSDALFNVWSNLGLLCFKSPGKSCEGVCNNDETLFEPATSAMRAITQKLVEGKCGSHFRGLTESDLEQILQFAASSASVNVRINMVEIVGGMGCLSVMSLDDDSHLARNTAQFLLTAASKDTDVRVIVEAFDKLIDMFADDSTDVLCADMDVVPKLKQLLPALKARIGGLQQKQRGSRSAREFHVVMDIAKTNLQRFIRYKERRPLIGKK